MNNKKLISIIRGLHIIVFGLGLILFFRNWLKTDDLIQRVDDISSRAVIELKEMESLSDQVLNSIHYELDKVTQADENVFIDQVTEIGIEELIHFSMMVGVCYHFTDDFNIYIYKIGENEYLRLSVYDDKEEVLFEKFNFFNNKLSVAKKWKGTLDSLDSIPDWIEGARLKRNQLSITTKFFSKYTHQNLHILSKKMDDFNKKCEVVGLMMSLEKVADKLMGKADGGALLIKGSGKDFLVVDNLKSKGVMGDEASPYIINNPEIDKFLSYSYNKEYQAYIPKKYYSHGSFYVGKWIGFKIGRNEFKLGVLQKHKKDIVSLAFFCCISLIIIISFYLLGKIKNFNVTELSKDHGDKSKKNVIVSNDVNEKIWQESKTIIHQDNFFLKPECTLPYIAKQSGFNRDEIIQSVQLIEQKTFKEYLSDLRINEAVKYFENEDSKEYSIDHLAAQFGYNSRTTFYREFKKRTGYSPAEYQHLHKHKD